MFSEEHEAVIRYITRHIPLTDEQRLQIASLLKTKQVRKRQQIVQPDFVCRHRSYIFRGTMRAYLNGNEGQEHTIALGIDDWWISDYSSYIFQQPATLFVEALEPTTLVQIDFNAEQLLKETVPGFEKFFRIITERSFAFLQKRMLDSLSLSAERRYDQFLAKYPALAARVPQYVLASYLGMSTEYLSKLRRQKAERKS